MELSQNAGAVSPGAPVTSAGAPALGAAVADVPGTAARGRLDREGGRLLGSRCPRCDAVSWPARALCHRLRDFV